MTGISLLAGRRAVEALMQDSCVISADPGNANVEIDPVTLLPVVPTDAIRYRGKCYVGREFGVSREIQEGGAQVREQMFAVSIPLDGPGYVAGAGELREGDLVTITASKLDERLAGEQYTILSFDEKSFVVKRTIMLQHRPREDT
jgi:hypothetical protein